MLAWGAAMIWMIVSPLNSYVEILMPNVMVLEGGAFGRWLGHEGGALMNAISALIKETPKSSLAPPIMWGHREKSETWEEGPHPTMLAPRSQTSSLQKGE